MQPSGAFRTAAFRSFDQCLSPFCRFNSANSAFISAISTFSFSSHSSRVCAYTFRACFLPSIHIGEYTDASSVSSWATDAMQWAVDAGLINGRTATTLAPQGTATRAEVAAILMRFAQKIAK